MFGNKRADEIKGDIHADDFTVNLKFKLVLKVLKEMILSFMEKVYLKN